MNSVIKGASYVLVHTPDMVLHNGTTQTTERIVNPESEYLKDLPEHLRTHKNTTSFLDRFKVVAGNLTFAQTVVAHICRDGHYYIHPDKKQNRSLTPREAARIQTFPDNYYFESASGKPSRTLAYKQIGNAVPVRLAKCIATALMELFAKEDENG